MRRRCAMQATHRSSSGGVPHVVLRTGFGDPMRAAFEADVAQSKAVTLEGWRQRPLGDRAKAMFSRLWQHWL